MYARTDLQPTFQADNKTYRSWKVMFSILVDKGLRPYRVNYDDETRLDIGRLHEWRHVKHPSVRYVYAIWGKERTQNHCIEQGFV